ncbi:MAG: hypothetical protein ACKV2T_10160 [Kofleriaceae bacterium]
MAARVERRVLAETRVVFGVETHILEHKTFYDGQIHEIAANYYVEATDGTVCYFGEYVEFYENGQLANTDGTWLAGVDGARPGVIMPAVPSVGTTYYQENAPGIAEDMGRVTEVGGTLQSGNTMYTNVLTIMDVNPRENCGEEEPKRYAPGVGEIVDVTLSVVEVTPAP